MNESYTLPPAPNDTFSTDLVICYEVLLYLSSRLARLAPGETLEFVTGDPEAAETIPPWCEAREYTLIERTTLTDGRLRFLIRK